MDDLNTLASARRDPKGFVEALPSRAFLDEVQRAPEVFLPIKAAVDRDRRPGRFVLTGSANVLALPRVSDSLAGRMEILTLWPLAQAEIEGTSPGFIDACFSGQAGSLRGPGRSRTTLVQRVLAGGYPEALARATGQARARWFDGYLTTLVQRDVRDLAQIEGVIQLPSLLATLAARAGSPLNFADLGRNLAMNQMTVKRYIALFEALFLVVTLPPWSDNLGKRLAKTAKIYFNDAGLLAHLLGVDADGLAHQSVSKGALVENFAVMELMKLAANSQARPSLFHFRTSSGQEVDVVMENRHGLAVQTELTQATGTAEREAAVTMITAPAPAGGVTLGADKNYDTQGCVAQLRDAGLGPDDGLYGLYEGIPRTEYAADWAFLPNKITLFQVALLEDFPDPAELENARKWKKGRRR